VAIKYVALDGNDSADGSLATPWASIEYAIEDGGINGGDTLQLMCNTNGSESPCVYDATNFWKSGSDKVITKSVTGGTLTLQQYMGMNVTLNWPSDSAANTMLLTGTWVFDHLNFTNTHAVAQYLVKMYHGGSDITFQDGLIDQGKANHSMFYLNPSTTGYFTLNRMKVTNTTSKALIEIFPVGGASTIVTRFLSSVFYNTGWLYYVTYPGYANDLYMYNNTFVNGTERYKFWNLDNNGVRDFRNNIFRGDQTFYEPIFSNNATSIDPAKWTVKHNLFYITGLVDPSPSGKAGEYLAILNNGQFPLDETNYFIDPQFSNEVIGKATGGSNITLVDSTVDFTALGLADGMTVINTNTGVSSTIATGGITAHTITLATTCAFSANNFYHILKSNSYIPTNTYIDGRGDVSVLPVGGDSNGHAWTGADVGAVYNPGSLLVMPSITANTIACLGDSTSQGLCNQISLDNALSPIVAVGTGIMGAAIGGTLGEGLKWFVDRAATTWHPQYVVLLSWNNNFNSSSVTPTNLTYQQAADDMMIAVKKAKYWGMIPIVLNMGGSTAATTASQVAQSNTLGPLLETGCIVNNVSYGNPLERMRFNPNFANIYSSSGTEGYYQTGGLASNIHPAAAGYKLMYSVVKDLLAGHQNTIYITQTGTSIVGSQYGAGTTLYPLSVVGLNAQTVGGGYVDLPMGVAGQTISASGAFSTTLVTPSAGASGRLLSLIGGTWQAGAQLTQAYWKMISGAITGKDASNNTLTISGANVEADNLSISGSTSSGISVTENTTFKNIAVKESSGTSITIASGKTITGSNNCFYSSAKSGDGIYTDSGNPWSCNPLFTSSSDLHPLSGSPVIDAGASVSGITTDFDANTLSYGTPDIGAYEYQPPYTVGTTPVPTSGSIRIYSNNKYRALIATTTSTTIPAANFSVTPVGGFLSASTSQYMDITINQWDTTGAKNKQWTATSTSDAYSTHATSTVYTIGDLLANTPYTFKLDGVPSTAITSYGSTTCTSGVCTSDSSGVVQFTYTGGYSTHTFALTLSAPTASTQAAVLSSTSRTGATLNGTIATGGVITVRGFAYGTDPTLATVISTTTDTVGQPFSTGTFTTNLSNLSYNTTYYFRPYATNAAGDGLGTISSFTTLQRPGRKPSPQTVTTPTIVEDLVSTPATSTSPVASTTTSLLADSELRSASTTPPTSPIADEGLRGVSIPPITTASATFTRILKLKSTGDDVKALQQFLNTHGFPIATKGAGSRGKETTYFGTATKTALMKYQKSIGLPQVGQLGPLTRGEINKVRP